MAGGEVTMKIVVRLGICQGDILVQGVGGAVGRPTISDSRAREGRRVAGASRCRSMASKTRTKRKSLCRGGWRSILESSTVNCDRFSHLDGLLSQSSASATLLIVRSSRWRPVMHSIELTMVYRKRLVCSEPSSRLASFSRTASVTAVFPVASVP